MTRSVLGHAFDVLDREDRGRLPVRMVCDALSIEPCAKLDAFWNRFVKRFEFQKIAHANSSQRQLSQRRVSGNKQPRVTVSKACFTSFIQKLVDNQTEPENRKMLTRLGYDPETLLATSKRIFNLSVHSESEVWRV